MLIKAAKRFEIESRAERTTFLGLFVSIIGENELVHCKNKTIE